MTASTDYLFRRNRRLARQKWGPAINHDLLETLVLFRFRRSIKVMSSSFLPSPNGHESLSGQSLAAVRG